jgi:hypothetical protein
MNLTCYMAGLSYIQMQMPVLPGRASNNELLKLTSTRESNGGR